MRSGEEFFRIRNLPPYPLGEIAARVKQGRQAGKDIIDLSQVNPSLGPPPAALEALVQASLQTHNHRYSASQGIERLRLAASEWYASRYGVRLDHHRQVIATFGTKEGLAHLLLSVVSPGDTVIVPTPSYPIHTSSVFIAGASHVGVPLFSSPKEALGAGYELSEDNDAFFERLDLLYHRSWPRPRLMILNFPHNPTGATATLGFFARLVQTAHRLGIYLVHDFAYADVAFDGYKPPSILQVEGAEEVAVEAYSLSKGISLPGWRIGFLVGNEKLVSALRRIKGYLDFGVFQPLQVATAKILSSPESEQEAWRQEVCGHYSARRDILYRGLKDLGWGVHLPKASMFVWGEMPEGIAQRGGSLEFSAALLEQASVAVCPGVGFDIEADNHIRFALVEDEERTALAVERIGAMEW